MALKKALTVAALLGTIVSVAPVVANAGTITFAQIAQIKAARTFYYKNEDIVKVTGKKPNQITTVTPKDELLQINSKGNLPIVNFTSLIDGVGVSAGQTLKAYMQIHATNEDGIITINGVTSQLFDGFIQFTEVGNNKLLLRDDFTAARLTATVGSFSFNMNGNIQGTGQVVYSSDVYATLGHVNDFGIAGSGTNRAISLKPGYSFNNKGGFTGSITGTFSTTVPEPTTLGVGLLGLGMIGLARRRQKVAA